ncbi:hypothetical protein NQZ79_g7803 [Umbelopsis isabellina]|nr:hypothetical protein NQZ79_g7803 [Umbelopsis isabellina]
MPTNSSHGFILQAAFILVQVVIVGVVYSIVLYAQLLPELIIGADKSKDMAGSGQCQKVSNTVDLPGDLGPDFSGERVIGWIEHGYIHQKISRVGVQFLRSNSCSFQEPRVVPQQSAFIIHVTQRKP